MSNLVTSKFYNQFNNGKDLDQNLGDFTVNLAANISDLEKTVQRVSISWISQSNSSSQFTVSGNTITRISGSFILDQFSVGDVIELRDIAGASDLFTGRNITVISNTQITFDGATLGAAVSYPNARLYGKTPLTTLRYKFGLIGNSEATNYVNKIDGTVENEYTAEGITTAFTTMSQNSGVQSSIESVDLLRIKYIETRPQAEDYAQIFEIEHTFAVNPAYLDGDGLNFSNNIPVALFSGSNTIKYVSLWQMNIALSNPNGTKELPLDTTNGSVGWANQSLNGGKNNYSVDPVTFTHVDDLSGATQVDAQRKTRLNFDLISTGATFNANTDVGVTILTMFPASEYQQNQNTIDENLLVDRAFERVDQVAGTGYNGIISNLTATSDTTSKINIEFDIDYTTVNEPRLESQLYVILISTSDSTKTGVDTDRVQLLVDVDKYLYNTDVQDLIFIDEMMFFPHDVDDTDTSHAFDNYVGGIEDGFTIKSSLLLNHDLTAKMNTLKFHLSAFNSLTDDTFHLQTYVFNLSSMVVYFDPLKGIIHQLNVSGDRGFQLVTGSQFNKALIERISFAVRGPIAVEKYDVTLGIKMNFEEWIALPGANGIFYDALEPNDGLNKKSSRYSLKEDYDIRVIVESSVEDEDGNVTPYEFISQQCVVYDYDEDENVTPEWAVDIKTLNQNGFDTSGLIPIVENTVIEATFTPDGGSHDLIDPYAIIRLNPRGGTINTIYEISSIRERKNGIPLAPLPGESYTKITDNGTDVVVECEIDFTKIDTSVDYDITAVLRDSSTIVGIETELGVLISTEDGQVLIIE